MKTDRKLVLGPIFIKKSGSQDLFVKFYRGNRKLSFSVSQRHGILRHTYSDLLKEIFKKVKENHASFDS